MPAIINRIVVAINSYALYARKDKELLSYVRLQIPINSIDIQRFIGCLLYIGYHKLTNHKDYQSKSGHLRKFISLKRYKQIHRYFTLQDRAVYLKQKNEIFVQKVEPIATLIRQNYKVLQSPSSHLVVDEAIIAYRDRTINKVKLLNKPIKKGYKVQVLEDCGYVWDWLQHSHVDRLEDILKKDLNINRVESTELIKLIKMYLALIFALILRLALRLYTIYPERIFCFFLDNLFLNINVS